MKLLKYNCLYILIIIMFYIIFIQDGIFYPSGIKKLPDNNANIYENIETKFNVSDIYGKMKIYEEVLVNQADTKQKDIFLQDHFIDIYFYFQNNISEETDLQQYYFLLKRTITWYEVNYSKLSNISPYIFLHKHRPTSLFQRIIIEESIKFKRYSKLKELKDMYENSAD